MRAAHTDPKDQRGPGRIVTVPALSVMVFLHKEIGYQLLRPVVIIGLPIGLLLFFYWLGDVSRGKDYEWFFAPNNWAMGIFAVAFGVRAVYLRWAHWNALKGGLSWPTNSPGRSYLGEGANNVTYRLVEPVLCFATGYFVKDLISWPLGIWLMWAGISLALWERLIWRDQLRRHFDAHDTILEGAAFSQHAERFTNNNASRRPDEGFPTGLGDDH